MNAQAHSICIVAAEESGDALLVNLTGEQTGAPSHCTDIWIGADTHKLVTERIQKGIGRT